jgi:hypothetical protein
MMGRPLFVGELFVVLGVYNRVHTPLLNRLLWLPRRSVRLGPCRPALMVAGLMLGSCYIVDASSPSLCRFSPSLFASAL